jgi:REP element-mobilizing transposase RayT
MAVRTVISDEDKLFYITFTCFEWLPLIEFTNSYDLVYKWFDYLNTKNIEVIGYVIMPNHIHCVLNFPEKGFSLNNVISNAKRFMAYEIINRLSSKGEHQLLNKLKGGLTGSRVLKGQLHSAFKLSFDAKAIRSEKFLDQKLNYMHLNPVRGIYNLVEDWRNYPHSSAGFYEYGNPGHFKPVHYMESA